MNQSELQKKVSEILGVSSSEKELAFDIFISKVYDILLEGITLKVSRVGYFQIKDRNDDDSSDRLLFAPLTEDFSHDNKTLYLTLNLPTKQTKISGSDSSVFSIGVGKPVLPLNSSESSDSETSYAILKKSIEERVNEILAEAHQIPNFNIWDDYYNSLNQNDDAPDTKDTLSDLTSDLDIKDDEINAEITRNLLDVISEVEPIGELDDENIEPISPTDLLSDYIPKVEIKPEDFELPKDNFDDGVIEAPLVDEFENEDDKSLIDIDDKTPEVINGIEPENIDAETNTTKDEIVVHKDESQPDDQLTEDVSPDNENVELKDEIVEPHIETNEVEEPVFEIQREKNISKKDTAEELTESEDEIVYELKKKGSPELESFNEKLNQINLEEIEKEVDDFLEVTKKKQEPPEYLGLKKKPEEPVDWNWGDELKDEFGGQVSDNENPDYDFVDDEPSGETKEENIFKSTRPIKINLFDELETTIKKEIRETNAEQFEPQPKYESAPNRYEFIEADSENEYYDHPNQPYSTYDRSTEELLSEYEEEKGFSGFGKYFLIIFASFVVVTSLIIYFMMNNKTSEPKQTVSQNKVDTSEMISPNTTPIQNDGREILSESDFPRVASLSDNTKQPSSAKTDVTPTKTTEKKTPETKSPNNNLYKSVNVDTRVSKTVYFDGKSYNFQVSSWRNKYKAEQEVQRLRNQGYNAFVLEAYLPEKGGTWYRVRIGSFQSREEAEQFYNNNKF